MNKFSPDGTIITVSHDKFFHAPDGTLVYANIVFM